MAIQNTVEAKKVTLSEAVPTDALIDMARLQEKRRVLVVDDDSLTRAQIKKVIADLDEDVVCTTAASVDEALSLLHSFDFDLLIADYYLPQGQTGLDLWMKASAEFPELEGIIISSIERKDFHALTQNAGIQPLYCQKPIDNKKMKGILRFLLGGS